MKKLLLFGAASMLASASALAAQPMELGDFQARSISPNGKMIGSTSEGNVSFFFPESEDYVNFNGDDTGAVQYSLGLGNCISNTGVAVGESTLDGGAAVYKNGEWTPVPVLKPNMTNLLNGITPDGLRICGSLGLQTMSTDDYDTPMLVPAVWDLQEDGTYGEPVRLPHPDLDFTGRVPQYITANYISDDGKTVVGQIVDYTGFFPILIWYRLGDDNKWTYTLEDKALYNPNNIEFPEYPGDGPAMPTLEDFMTDTEKDAYNAAYDQWYNDCMESGNWDYSNVPVIEDFATDEQKAQYNAALEAWQTEHAEWEAKFMAFMDAFYSCMDNGKPLVFNSASLSPDGKKVVANFNTVVENDDPLAWERTIEIPTLIVFNLEDGSYEVYEPDYASPTCILNDGTIFAGVQSSEFPTKGVVYLKGEKTATPITDYVTSRNAAVGEWMKQNMFHDVEAYNWETDETTIIENLECTGYPTATPDLSVIVSYVENVWDQTGGMAFGYYLPLSESGSVNGVADNADFSVKALKGGKIVLAGEVLNVTVYDADGRMLINAAPQGDVIETGLAAGAYIVKATGANGEKVLKAMF